jgi:uncharacterized protein
MSTVIITGGTGLIGRTLTKILLDKGYKVIILTRDPAGKTHGEKISYAAWDIRKKEIDTDAVKKADHIIHLAGAGVVDKKWTEAYKKEIRESRIESSRLIIEALKNTPNSVRTVISASAIGWYGPDHEPVKPFTETDPATDDFLGQTCKLWEESIEPVTSLGIRSVKFRIGILLSNDGGALAEFKKPLHFGIAAILGNGKQVISWIHINDLCRMFIHALENENLHGTYNAVAQQPVSNKTLILTLAKKMRGKFFVPVHVPSFVLKIMLGKRSIEVLKSATVSCNKIMDTGFVLHFNKIGDAMKDLIKKD